MSRFLDALHSGRVLLMDGAMGTELLRAGLRLGENAAGWNVAHPARVAAVHRAYRDAGAEVLLTNTFALGLPGLAMPFDVEACWNRGLVLLGDDDLFRVADVGPTLDVAVPIADRVDAILLETWSSPEAEAALHTLRRSTKTPVLLSLTYRRDVDGSLTTASGHEPEWFARRAASWGVAALGVNCGRDLGRDALGEVVRRYRAVTDLPTFARPNAGTPSAAGSPLTPEEMAARLGDLLASGVAMVGGCCGTTPAHIAACRPVVAAWNADRPGPG